MHQVNLLPGAVSEIVVAVADTGVLTLADRYGLMAAILGGLLNEEEEQAINRVLRGVVKGRIKVVDEISNEVPLAHIK
ncbi:hypothetical protein B6N60_02842 [Richelia sinica FACHB-800]|uniref:Uncharacterized protein n=1 Tax=Richelia sinica FACHB-800 TaxID=1357546 RepID=A0A975T8G0_9NOST|nr:hypothetical protein [Richelia sinica]MBD2665344.1 hypothetical protein [Richelia sinica FACHB-800]QXE24138.1 hypothetical protein B6N60_02842 [Richelia sinica FACHB-800]